MSASNSTRYWRSYRELRFVLAICVCFSAASCGQSQVPPHNPDTHRLLEIVGEYSHSSKPSADVSPKRRLGQASTSSRNTTQEEGPYQRQIRALFEQGNFNELEKEAQDARHGKARVVGGTWKLFLFYDAVSKPATEDEATEGDWSARFSVLQKWASTYPESPTPSIAIAETYVNYAWAARGADYADTVAERGWKLFGERIELAKSHLVEAARLKTKCPHWYRVMQAIALAEGWTRPQARELFDRAVAFEPDYLQFYREYAYFLFPKWYGNEGDTEQFAEEVAKQVGGQQGDFIYFEIASYLMCSVDLAESHMPDMSWAKIKSGYEAMKQLYGVSDLKGNRFAFMAFVARDKVALKDALTLIGDRRDPRAWNSAEFERAKVWASGQ